MKKTTTTAKNLTFSEVLQSEFYYLVEAIEHECNDPEITQAYIRELKAKTGYEYKL